MGKLIDLTGKRFGRLSVLGAAESRSNLTMWHCLCDCGHLCVVAGKSMKSGATGSCGCAQRASVIARNKKHGLHGTKEYRVWKHIKGRCLCPTDAAFINYGGRGIGIDPDWANDFECFLMGVGMAPSSRSTLDRVDNEKGYVPGNTRWTDRKTQNRNTRRNIYVVVNGQSMVLKDACNLVGAPYSTISGRVRRGLDAQREINSAISRLAAGSGSPGDAGGTD